MKILLVAVCCCVLGVAAKPSVILDSHSESEDADSIPYQDQDDVTIEFDFHYDNDGWAYDEKFCVELQSEHLRSDIFDRPTICNFKAWDFYKECIKHETVANCRNEKDRYWSACMGNNTLTTTETKQQITTSE